MGPTIAQRNTLWVWKSTPADALMRLAGRYRVGRLLVWVGPGFSENRKTCLWLDKVFTAAQPRGIAVDALCGDPEWALQPQVAGKWAAEVAGYRRFARIHIDVEPHALPQWGEASAELIDALVRVVDAARVAGLPIDVDIPSWYWRFNTSTPGVTADVAVLNAADSITLMSYQDRANEVLAVSEMQMKAAAAVGKPAFIGVNLMQAPPEDPGSSMFGQSSAVIRSCLEQVEREGADLPMFGGLAIHDAASLARL